MNLTTYKTAAKSDVAAMGRLIKGMREAGWTTYKMNDGEVTSTLESNVSLANLTADLYATEEAWLYWKKDFDGVTHKASMYFVFGNSPWEVMCDCSDFPEWNADLKAVEEAVNLEGV